MQTGRQFCKAIGSHSAQVVVLIGPNRMRPGILVPADRGTTVNIRTHMQNQCFRGAVGEDIRVQSAESVQLSSIPRLP